MVEDKEESIKVPIAETPITVAYLTEKVKEKIFKGFEINTDNYCREVRRALFTHMFSEETICISKYDAFDRIVNGFTSPTWGKDSRFLFALL